MGVLQSYRLRLQRRRWRLRALYKRRELSPVADRTNHIRRTISLLFRNSKPPLGRGLLSVLV